MENEAIKEVELFLGLQRATQKLEQSDLRRVNRMEEAVVKIGRQMDEEEDPVKLAALGRKGRAKRRALNKHMERTRKSIAKRHAEMDALWEKVDEMAKVFGITPPPR